MRTNWTRRHVIAGAAALAIAGTSRAVTARQEPEIPGVDGRTFTSNFYDHELTWTSDWEPHPYRSEVREADGYEILYVEDQDVDWTDGPSQVILTLEPVGADFSPEAFIANLPDDAVEYPGVPPTAFVFGKGDSDDGAWLVYGWEPIEDRGNVGGVHIAQYLFPANPGDPLVTIAISMSGKHADEEVLERISDDFEFDGESIFVLEDYDEIWELIAEVY